MTCGKLPWVYAREVPKLMWFAKHARFQGSTDVLYAGDFADVRGYGSFMGVHCLRKQANKK